MIILSDFGSKNCNRKIKLAFKDDFPNNLHSLRQYAQSYVKQNYGNFDGSVREMRILNYFSDSIES